MAEVPSWAGPVGSTLVKAADAFLQGMMGPSFEEERQARERKAMKETADIELQKAHALYYGRPEKSTARPIKVGNKVVWVGPDGAEVLFEGPDATKPDDFLKESALQGAEELLGKSRHLWNAEDKLKLTTDPKLIKMMDVFKVRPDLISTPAGAVPRDTARAGDAPAQVPAKSGEPSGETVPSVVSPARTPAQATTPLKGTVFLGKATPEMEEAIAEAHRLYPQVRPELIRAMIARESSYNPYVRSGQGAEGLMQLMPGTSKEMGVKDPFDVKENIIGGTRYLAQQLAKYRGSEAMALAAYNAGPGRFDKGGRDLAQMPPETQAYVSWVQAKAGGPTAPAGGVAAPPVKSGTPPTPPVAEAKPSTTEVAPSPKPPASPPATTQTGFQPYRSDTQKEEDARKRASDERERERLRLQQQGLSLQEQEARLRELDRQEDNRRADAQLALSQTRTNAYLKELEDANKRKDEAAAFRVTQNVMRETREARGMIQGVDETVALIQEMRRYISPETVGVKGAVRGAWQSVWGQLTDAAATKPLQGNAAAVQRLAMETAGRHAQEAEKFGGTWQLEENERARAEGRAPNKIYIPDYSKYGYDPRMRFIDFLKEVIAYAHARAMNGPGRLTDQDLNRAQKSLGIDGWINSAADMQTSIGYVEQQLKAKKARAQAYAASVEKTLRKHRPGAVEAGGEDVTPPPEE